MAHKGSRAIEEEEEEEEVVCAYVCTFLSIFEATECFLRNLIRKLYHW
jgi:hypothetical protein